MLSIPPFGNTPYLATSSASASTTTAPTHDAFAPTTSAACFQIRLPLVRLPTVSFDVSETGADQQQGPLLLVCRHDRV
jgi:hypothetical protein